MSDFEEVESTVQKFLNGGKNNKALKFLLEDPPVASKDKDLKVRLDSTPRAQDLFFFNAINTYFLNLIYPPQDKYAELVFNVMKSIRAEKISVSVGKLDADQLDVLMK